MSGRMNGPPGRLTSLPPLILALALLAACGSAEPGLYRFPTAASTRPVELTPTPAQPPTLPPDSPTPTPADASLPAVALPDASGTSVACEANTLRLTPTQPTGEPFAALSRVAAHEDWLYLLGDGGLYRVERPEADSGPLQPEPVIVPGERIAGRPVQELADIALDRERGLLYALDKAGHVFRYEIVTGVKILAYRATYTADETDELDPQFVALAVDALGRPLLLDTAHGALQTPGGIEALEVVNQSRGLTDGVDLAASGSRVYVLTYNGVIRAITSETGSVVWRDADGRKLGLSLKTSDHLGVDLLYAVDGLRREVVGINPADARDVTRTVFAFPDMGLLRDVVFAGGRLYAVADGDLLVYPGPAGEDDPSGCVPPAPGAEPRPTLYGVDVVAAMQGAVIPVEGEWELPTWPRVYPGASRLYRSGVHHGLDLYGFSGPKNFKKGWPVLAALDGEVVRATVVYEGLNEESFEALLAEAEALGETPPEVLERLAGKHVVIDHGEGLSTTYFHLDEIAPGVVPGAHVQAGQVIGTVGVTGTLGEVKTGTVGAHLHFEVWVGGHYLGYGLTIRETTWWFEQILGSG